MIGGGGGSGAVEYLGSFKNNERTSGQSQVQLKSGRMKQTHLKLMKY